MHRFPRSVFYSVYRKPLPRSTWLNCEQGVLILKDGELRWSDGNETFDSDPKASAGRRFRAWLTRVLHLEAQL